VLTAGSSPRAAPSPSVMLMLPRQTVLYPYPSSLSNPRQGKLRLRWRIRGGAPLHRGRCSRYCRHIRRPLVEDGEGWRHLHCPGIVPRDHRLVYPFDRHYRLFTLAWHRLKLVFLLLSHHCSIMPNANRLKSQVRIQGPTLSSHHPLPSLQNNNLHPNLNVRFR
jgi:hypothetical protein